MTKADHRLCSNGDWVCNVCKESFENAPGFEFYQCPTCHDDYCNKDECKQVPERDYSEERKPWQFVPNMETEFLQFLKVEEDEPEEERIQREGLGQINLEQGIEVGFINASGSSTTQCPIEVAFVDESKFSRADGDASYTYTFEKPILFSGYMIQTGKAEDNSYTQPKAWTIKVNDLLEGGSDIQIDEVTGEVERGPLEEKEYHIAEDKEVWTDSVTINITGRMNDEDGVEISRFSILTS